MKTEKMVSFDLRNLSILIKRYAEKDRAIDCQHSHHNHQHGSKGMTHMHMNVLGYLHSKKDEDVFQRDFEKEFSIRRSTATNMLKRMEKNGLISRIPVPGDARLKKIVLTDKALKISKDMDKKALMLEKKMIENLTDEEIKTFSTVLKKMIHNMEE